MWLFSRAFFSFFCMGWFKSILRQWGFWRRISASCVLRYVGEGFFMIKYSVLANNKALRSVPHNKLQWINHLQHQYWDYLLINMETCWCLSHEWINEIAMSITTSSFSGLEIIKENWQRIVGKAFPASYEVWTIFCQQSCVNAAINLTSSPSPFSTK